jgi:TRAP-type C4-dicarboxylate transport system substrate-binding protein
MSVYQPVDLMDFCVGMNHWNAASPKIKQFMENEIESYSNVHFGAIQKADMEAWGKFEKAGTQVSRLSPEDVDAFTDIAVPIWFKWANKDKEAARLFKAQLDIMMSPTIGYVNADQIKGQKLDL